MFAGIENCGQFQILGFVVGAVAWLRNIIIGENAPLGVVYDSIALLGYVCTLCVSGYSMLIMSLNGCTCVL